MADFTTTDVKKLRELTAAGIVDCKQALTEAAGDFAKAVEILRVKGAKGVSKRESRTAANGLITALLQDASTGVVLELNCETDFVAKSERFGQLAEKLAALVAKTSPANAAVLLATQADDGRTVRELLDEANAAVGEKIALGRFAQFADGYVAAYLHKTSPDLPPTLGVLVELAPGGSGNVATTAKDIAQHIAASVPRYVTRDQVPEEVVAAERRIAEAIAREEGKPEQALPKIVAGRLTGFFKENVLVEQPFVKDAKKTVQVVLDEAGMTVTRFARYKIGVA